MEIFDVFLLFLAEPFPWASSKCPKEGSHRVSARSAKNSRGYKRSKNGTILVYLHKNFHIQLNCEFVRSKEARNQMFRNIS
jgi:hypothetical protein